MTTVECYLQVGVEGRVFSLGAARLTVSAGKVLHEPGWGEGEEVRGKGEERSMRSEATS